MSNLQSQVEEQRKLIEFLKSKYEKDTGLRVALPQTLGKLLGDDSILAEGAAEKSEEEKMKNEVWLYERILALC